MSSKTLAKFLEENLEDLKSKGLYNVIDPLEGPNGPIIQLAEKNILTYLQTTILD